MTGPKWTAKAIVDALRVAYGVAGSELVTDEWAFLTEVPLRTPDRHGREDRWSGNTRTIDVMLARTWASGVGFRRIGVEVKVSRADYRNETPAKREPVEHAAHQTYYATPAGLLRPEELPAGWGLFEVYADERSYRAGKGWEVGEAGRFALVKCRVRATDRVPDCNLDYLASVCARRASRAEERIRRGEDDAAAVPGLRADVERLTMQLDRRDTALDRERSRVRSLRELVAAAEGGHDCADCGKPVALDTRSRSMYAWKHRAKADDVACEQARAEADRAAKEARYGTRYLRGWAPPVEPRALREQAADLD